MKCDSHLSVPLCWSLSSYSLLIQQGSKAELLILPGNTSVRSHLKFISFGSIRIGKLHIYSVYVWYMLAPLEVDKD